MENRRNILMDCDPGIDDAAALCVAAAHPEAFRILGISTVAGNQTIETVTENALRLTQFFGLDVPVAQGAKVPLTRRQRRPRISMEKTGLAMWRFQRRTERPFLTTRWSFCGIRSWDFQRGNGLPWSPQDL